MYPNPIGMAMRDITSDNVALSANVTSSSCVFLGSILVADARRSNNDDEPMKKIVKVPTKQMSRFRLLWEVPAWIDNLSRAVASTVRRYLGKLVLGLWIES